MKAKVLNALTPRFRKDKKAKQAAAQQAEQAATLAKAAPQQQVHRRPSRQGSMVRFESVDLAAEEYFDAEENGSAVQSARRQAQQGAPAQPSGAEAQLQKKVEEVQLELATTKAQLQQKESALQVCPAMVCDPRLQYRRSTACLRGLRMLLAVWLVAAERTGLQQA